MKTRVKFSKQILSVILAVAMLLPFAGCKKIKVLINHLLKRICFFRKSWKTPIRS